MKRPAAIGERNAIGEAYLAGRLRQHPLHGEFRPSRREDVNEIAALPAGERRRFVGRAIAALQAGEVATGVLAAGASTRMSLEAMPVAARRLLERAGGGEIRSKALVPVVELEGRVLSFLDLFIENCVGLCRETQSSSPALLLVSEANAGEIEGALAARGVSALTFRQSLDRQVVATAEDVERARANFASDEDVVSALALSRAFAGHTLEVRKPAGHGEFLHQLVSSGMLGTLLERGIRYVSIRNIDNLGALLDGRWLTILGRMIERGARFTVEVSRRPNGPAGKGGALVVRPGPVFELAEDPSFAGTGKSARDSYYINNATAILEIGYLFRIYETSAQEIRGASPEQLAKIAERGRRKFPALLDVKPVRLPSGEVAGAFVPETNLWESTSVAPDLGVDAIGVLSVKDVEEAFETLAPEEQRRKAEEVRFVATKKWEDYEGINARLAPHLARKAIKGPLIDSEDR